jgi:hypothetical protein
MLEVVFDSGIKGVLKHAINYNPDSWRQGAMAFLGERPSDEELMKMYAGKPIGGNRADVVQFGFFNDIGNIQDGFDGSDRRELYKRFFSIMPGYALQMEQTISEIQHDFERIVGESEKEISIRVWVDSSPYSVCGYYCLCDLLRHAKCRLSKVVMPEYWQDDENTMSKGGWNSVHPGKFYQFLNLEKDVPQIERLENSARWKELVKENAPLRAIINGRLMSVPIDFYDYLIVNELLDTPIVMGKLLGRLMMKHALGISDAWYRFRIEAMIKNGDIDIIGFKDESHPYGAILKKRVNIL